MASRRDNNMQQCKHIIGICGRRRSGKDVVADHIQANYGYHKSKIADKLKEVCKVMFGFSDEDLEIGKDDIHPTWGVPPRKLMQFLGTEIMQFKIQEIMPEVGRNFWMHALQNDASFRNNGNVVISDLRFVHEFLEMDAIPDCKTHIIRILRPRQCLDERLDHHSSETESDQITADYTIVNDSSIEELLDKIDRVMLDILRNKTTGTKMKSTIK